MVVLPDRSNASKYSASSSVSKQSVRLHPSGPLALGEQTLTMDPSRSRHFSAVARPMSSHCRLQKYPRSSVVLNRLSSRVPVPRLDSSSCNDVSAETLRVRTSRATLVVNSCHSIAMFRCCWYSDEGGVCCVCHPFTTP